MFLEFKVKCWVQDNASSILSAEVFTCTFTDILFIVYVNQSLGLLKVKQWSNGHSIMQLWVYHEFLFYLILGL